MEIVCVDCGHTNPSDSKYCEECGIDLPIPANSEPTPVIESIPQEVGIVERHQAENAITEEVEAKLPEDPLSDSSTITQSESEYDTSASVIESDTSDRTPDDSSSELVAVEEQEVDEHNIINTPVVTNELEAQVEPSAGSSIDDETPTTDETVAAEQPRPLSMPTVLDWDEPSPEPEPEPEITSPPTTFNAPRAFLIHTVTDTRFELPTDFESIYLGKPNQELPIQIDLSELPDADIISRVHALIVVENDTYYLEDAGSLNGTELNGELLKTGARFRKQLKSGDVITMGKNRKIEFKFEQES